MWSRSSESTLSEMYELPPSDYALSYTELIFPFEDGKLDFLDRNMLLTSESDLFSKDDEVARFDLR